MSTSHGSTARMRLLVSLAVGVLGGLIATALGAGISSVLVGWDFLALTFCAWAWRAMWRLDADATARHASRDDPSRDLADLMILGAAVVSMVAVGVVLFRASHEGSSRDAAVILALATIFLSWLLVHTVFTLKYARLYHLVGGGIDFNEEDPPQYTDFAYLSFTIGMTFQVSDTDIGSKQIRRTALQHAWIAFPLVALIIAAAINLVAGLAK